MQIALKYESELGHIILYTCYFVTSSSLAIAERGRSWKFEYLS
ncbi:unnamed protein product [Brassica oleracea]